MRRVKCEQGGGGRARSPQWIWKRLGMRTYGDSNRNPVLLKWGGGGEGTWD